MSDEAAEEWRTILGHENYAVSNTGLVKRRVGGMGATAGKILRPSLDKDGYQRVGTYDGGGQHTMHIVSRLVAMAFIPDGALGLQVNHKDGDKTNNHFKNLEWVTGSENTQHAYDIKLRTPQCGESSPRAKLTNAQVRAIRRLRGTTTTQKEMASRFGVSRVTICDILAGRTWVHLDDTLQTTSSEGS